ncbi:phosphatase PAP2 family protein [Oxalobacteraceae bacterium OM1]|nr:phosphatase PAP2 family protein [Oxalobacteraceae bacterium OM1]
MTTLEALNHSLFLILNAAPDTPVWRLHLATILANDTIIAIPLLLLIFWLWGDAAQRSLTVKATVVTGISLAVNLLIGLVWPHPRPFMIGLGHTYIHHVADPSFPSDHGTIFAAIALTLVCANARSLLAWTFVMLGVAVAGARIYLGVHFPLDMVGALGVVVLVTLAVNPLWKRLGARLTEALCRPYRGLFARPIASGWVRR